MVLRYTSEWALDYPLFFAYFEHLSPLAHIVDPQIVHLHDGLNYKANSAIHFQRISVIVSDLLLLYGVYRSTRNLPCLKRYLIWALVIWSPPPRDRGPSAFSVQWVSVWVVDVVNLIFRTRRRCDGWLSVGCVVLF